MKRFFKTQVFTAIIFFCVGFLTNHFLVKLKRQSVEVVVPQEDRYAVNPDDFDHMKMLDSIGRMSEENAEATRGASTLGMISERFDEKNVYYDVPLKGDDGVNHKLNVEIKDGMVKISEDIKDNKNGILETKSERMFTIGEGLDVDRAEVINQKDKITIRIPKK